MLFEQRKPAGNRERRLPKNSRRQEKRSPSTGGTRANFPKGQKGAGTELQKQAGTSRNSGDQERRSAEEITKARKTGSPSTGGTRATFPKDQGSRNRVVESSSENQVTSASRCYEPRRKTREEGTNERSGQPARRIRGSTWICAGSALPQPVYSPRERNARAYELASAKGNEVTCYGQKLVKVRVNEI